MHSAINRFLSLPRARTRYACVFPPASSLFLFLIFVRKCVTYVSEHLLPISRAHTLIAALDKAIHRLY